MHESCLDFVGFGPESGARGHWLALDREVQVGPQGCLLAFTPRVVFLAGAETFGAGLPWVEVPGVEQAGPRAVSCPGFTLEIRRGKARFGRSFALPRELRGQGLGTYLLAGLVCRAVRLGFGGVPVHGLHLIKQQNTPLRNAFYRSMGFTLTLYRDGSGWVRAPRLDVLRMEHDPEKVWKVQGLSTAASSI